MDQDLEEEKIPYNQEPNLAPLSKETLRLHDEKLKQSQNSQNFTTEGETKRKEGSEDSFTSISTDIQNAIHYDLLENDIYHTCNYSRDSGSIS